MSGELYVLQTGSAGVGGLTQRALWRLHSADAVVAGFDLDPRLLALLPHPPRPEDPLRLALDGLRVAWLVSERPASSDWTVPWEFLPAAPAWDCGAGACPLQGIGVVVTRPRHQADDLLTRLELLGARSYGVPSIMLVPPPDYAVLDAALSRLETFDWLVFTSANAISPFMARPAAAGGDTRRLARMKVASIGPATARALAGAGLVPDLVPAEFVAEGLLDALGDVRGQRFLIPRASEARDVLPRELQARGAEVVVAPVYVTVPDPTAEPVLRRLFAARQVDVVTFTASSTVTHFAVAPPAGVRIVCIGPVTARTAQQRGWQVDAQPAEYTTDGLVAELITLFR